VKGSYADLNTSYKRNQT